MKKLILTSLLVLLTTTFTVSVKANTLTENAVALAKQAGTSAVATAKEITTNAVATATQLSTNSTVLSAESTINGAVIDILRSGKSVGSEIYNASKTAITKSIDFTMEQAPLVVTEFIHWKIAEACVWLAIWTTVALFFLYMSRRCRLSTFDTDGSGKWITRMIGLAIILFAVGIEGMVIVKVAVAPRVFLIDYVVETIQNDRQGYHR